MSPKEKTVQAGSTWHEGDVNGDGVPGKKQPFSKRLKRNCGKWWWLYLLILIIVIIVVIVPIIFVGGRKLAQESIDKATVTVTYQELTNPGPNSFDLQLNSTVESHSDRQATIEGFNASFYLLNTKPDIKPFIYADFPEVQSAATNEVDITQQRTQIVDMEQFIAYNALVLNSETFSVGVQGNTRLVLPNLPKYSVNYDKVVTMKGYNKLSSLKIYAIQFHLPPLFDGATMTGKIFVNNPSVIRAQFGNITMQLMTNGSYLGSSVVEYVDFRPGNNTYDMRGFVNTTLALQNLQNNVLDITLQGNSSVNIAGQHLTYFEGALKSNTMKYRLNLTEAASLTP